MPIFSAPTQSTTVGTSAVAVFNPNAAPFSTLAGPLKDVIIENTSSVNTIYLGGSTVTTATGLPLGPNQQLTFNGFSTPAGASGTALYAIASGAAAAVAVSGLATININE